MAQPWRAGSFSSASSSPSSVRSIVPPLLYRYGLTAFETERGRLLRIATASGSAFLVAQLLDVTVFNWLRQRSWWRAPVFSSLSGSVIDTMIFFSIAFAASFAFVGPNDGFALETAPLLGVLAADLPRWMSWALGDLTVKLVIALVALDSLSADCSQVDAAGAGCLIPWVHLATAKVPGGGEDLRLKRRGSEFSIMLGTNELMNSRLSGSEEALAKLAIERIAGCKRPHILIGGLGMGFTLRAALAELGDDARIEVAELVPEIIGWARGEMAEVFGACLDDPRVTIHEADVGRMIHSAADAYNAILLDVDNGPEGLSRKSNDGLYDQAGLAAARAALKPGGVLAVWSSGPDSGFTRRLRQAAFTVEEVQCGHAANAAHGIRSGWRPKSDKGLRRINPDAG